VIYAQSAHEPLTEREWEPASVERAIREIVADAEASHVDGFWPAHPLDVEDGDPGPWTTVYLGSAGMAWALQQLGSSLDVGSIVDRALHRFRAAPDPGSETAALFFGEAGILLVADVLGVGDVDRLRELVVANERNPTWELFWGSPGTMLAARERGFAAEYERSAELVAEQWDGLWTQEINARTSQMLGPAHGYVGNVHALRGFFDDDELRRRIEPTLRRLAVVDGDLVNWPPVPGDECTRTQWCHGAPGIVATVGDLLPEDLLLGAAELTWRAGPLVKGAGLCHGTAGNGYALLRAHVLTGDELWLDRARRFAMHALEQVAQAPGRYSLFTGDVGAALFARSCLETDARFPTMDVW
jgi:hypothetical protein